MANLWSIHAMPSTAPIKAYSALGHTSQSNTLAHTADTTKGIDPPPPKVLITFLHGHRLLWASQLTMGSHPIAHNGTPTPPKGPSPWQLYSCAPTQGIIHHTTSRGTPTMEEDFLFFFYFTNAPILMGCLQGIVISSHFVSLWYNTCQTPQNTNTPYPYRHSIGAYG
jgi:hypothetical protein